MQFRCLNFSFREYTIREVKDYLCKKGIAVRYDYNVKFGSKRSIRQLFNYSNGEVLMLAYMNEESLKNY